ncbi:hypothetical protein SK128_004024, partial [Halocaridina rubra]
PVIAKIIILMIITTAKTLLGRTLYPLLVIYPIKIFMHNYFLRHLLARKVT